MSPEGASKTTDAIVCGVIDSNVWNQSYTTTPPLVSQMTTNGVPTLQAPFAAANMFTQQANLQFSTTGRNDTVVPVSFSSTKAPLPSGVNLVAFSDTNLSGMLP